MQCPVYGWHRRRQYLVFVGQCPVSTMYGRIYVPGRPGNHKKDNHEPRRIVRMQRPEGVPHPMPWKQRLQGQLSHHVQQSGRFEVLN